MKGFAQLHERDASGETARIYADIRTVLRSSWVPLPFRWLGAQSELLAPVWKALKPNLLSRAFEESADDLRATLARMSGDLGTPLIEPVLAWEGLDTDAIDEVRELANAFHYVYPKLVVASAALALAAGGHDIGGADLHPALKESRDPTASGPSGAPADMPSLRRLPTDPGPPTDRVFKRILNALHLPPDTTDLRLFGTWPRFLEAAWPELVPVFESDALDSRLAIVREQAYAGARRMPHHITLGTTEPTARKMRSVLEPLEQLFEAMPRVALFATAIKVSLDGVDDALASTWPVAWKGVREGATLGF